MCGIVGFTGKAQVAPILLDGLAKLEYRGYDSAGIAVEDAAGKIEIVKAKGRLRVLSEMTDGGTQYPVFGALQGVDTMGGSVDQASTATLLYADDEVACMDIVVTSESGVAFEGVVAAEIVRDE